MTLCIRTSWPDGRFDAVFSVLTLQFTPIEYRPHIVEKVYESLRPGGAFLLVEKVIGATASADRGFVELYRKHKHRAGYTLDEIQRKAAALEGVLVPVTDAWNRELLTGAGFRTVDCYWRFLNFAGYLAVRD